MLKRWDTRVYYTNRLLEVCDPLSLNPEPMRYSETFVDSTMFTNKREYNSKRFLNEVVSRGYLPIIKPKKRNPKALELG
jgi:hypothetical protein